MTYKFKIGDLVHIKNTHRALTYMIKTYWSPPDDKQQPEYYLCKTDGTPFSWNSRFSTAIWAEEQLEVIEDPNSIMKEIV